VQPWFKKEKKTYQKLDGQKNIEATLLHLYPEKKKTSGGMAALSVKIWKDLIRILNKVGIIFVSVF